MNYNPYITCPYCEDVSHSIYLKCICKITNDSCGMVRFCERLNKLIMTDNYNQKGCTISRNQNNI